MMKYPNNFIFFGSSEFSAIVLEKLYQAGLIPQLVITPPDKPVGRKKLVTPPPLKPMAEKLRLKTLQPPSLKNNLELVKIITELKPLLGVVAAYGKIIPKTILELFPKEILNLHPSLLPKYRGPSPIQTALLNGDKKTGISIILLDEQLDHGQILSQEEVVISPDDTFTDLNKNLALRGAEALKRVIPEWIEDKIRPQPQEESQTSYTKLFTWQDGELNPQQPAEQLYNRIRALNPEPGTWLNWQTREKRRLLLKILRAKKLSAAQNLPQPGLTEFHQELILVCQDGALILELVQPEGKKVMTGREFLNGYRRYLS